MTEYHLKMNTRSTINYKIFGFLITIILYCNVLSAQSVDEIKNSRDYIYGIGQGKTYQEADAQALDLLVSQISVRVESNFSNVVSEKGDSLSNYSQSVVRTYSNVSITQNRSKLISDEPGNFVVMRYLAVADLNEMFNSRKSKLLDYVQEGVKAENQLRLSDALRNYYWAFVMLRSHPDVNTIRGNLPDRPNAILLSAIPDEIDKIFKGITFEVISRKEDPGSKAHMVTLAVTYMGKAVQNFDFQYWTGDSYSVLTGVNDGLTEIELNKGTASTLTNVKAIGEYQNLNKSRWDAELNNLLKTTALPTFPSSKVIIKLGDAPVAIQKSTVQETNSASTLARADIPLPKVEESTAYTSMMNTVVKSINAGNPDLARNIFTQEGFDLFKRLFQKGQMRVLESSMDLTVYKSSDGFEVRNMPVKFSFRNSDKHFIEYLNFDLTKEKKIDHLAFSIGNTALNDIANRPGTFGSPEEKMYLINFLEDFKTAYSLRRIDFLKSVFDDNALIIVGRLLQDGGNIEKMYNTLGKKVEYIKLSKTEYLDRVQKAFAANEFVNLQFESTKVIKKNGEKIYGIQLEQYYTSSNYADKGYLFLMVDLKDSLKPKIYVRTWQPEKNPDGSVFNMTDFNL